MKKEDADYSLYLVTDSTPAILGDKDICNVVEAAVKGGVTCVQYRDKTSDTAALVSVARRLHGITKRHNVPLLINDRIDVALAVGCEGVHVGQDDMGLDLARKLLGPDAIIGVTVSSVNQALEACVGGADYLGIGTVYATQTKTNAKSIIGTAGVREILGAIADAGHHTQTVCIGGVNGSNLERVMFQCGSPQKSLDGVAVVSAIMAAPDPEGEARRLLGLVGAAPLFRQCAGKKDGKATEPGEIIALIPAVINAVHSTTPLSHNMTNLVVQNFSANVALAIGASPIMANYGEEAADLAKLGGALVINMGSVTPEGLENYLKALKAYNQAGRPVVLDPVGAGATSLRREGLKAIMAGGYLDVIKGNEGEIKTAFGQSGAQQRGVDSSSTLDTSQKAEIVRKLAEQEKCVVIMTGKTDFVSDGERTFSIGNGHEYLGMVTGTGCVLGTAVSAMLAVSPPDKLAAAIAGIVHLEIAAEVAAARQDVQGPGTFVPALIDELLRIRKATANQDLSWLQQAKISRCELDAGQK